MPKYIIEREIPGAGSLTRQDLQAISQKSCSILKEPLNKSSLSALLLKSG